MANRIMTAQISNFKEIKKNLEMEFSYIIFELAKSEAAESEFQRITDLLYQYKDCVVEHDLYYETSAKKIYLVAKLSKLVPEDLMMKVFRNMPEYCSAYLYNGVQNGP